MKYIETPFNYTGSKYKLLNQLLNEFDYKQKNFIDLFSGGGSVWTNILDKYENVYINDIIYELIYIQELLLLNPKDVIDKLRSDYYYIDKSDKDKYLSLRDEFNKNRDPYIFYSLLLSCTNNMIRFNKKGEFNQTFGKRNFNKNTEFKIYEWYNHVNKCNSKYFFYSDKFHRFVMNLYNKIEFDDSIFYIDPPYGYIDDNGEIGRKQISEAGYNAFWSRDDERYLYETIKFINMKHGKFVISGLYEHNGNKSWLLEKLIDEGYVKKDFNFNYDKVSRVKNNKNSKEIIIKNF